MKTSIKKMCDIISEASTSSYGIYWEEIPGWDNGISAMSKPISKFTKQDKEAIRKLFDTLLDTAGIYEDTGFRSYAEVMEKSNELNT